MQEKQIHIDGLLILLRLSPRARRLSVTVRTDLTVRVAVPLRVSFSRAEEFARGQLPWIRKRLTSYSRLRAEHLHLIGRGASIDRDHARQVLSARLNQLAASHGYTYNRLFIRSQKTRWGSCSARGNINLNLKLLLLPDHLRDYVLLHELLHTRIRGHGPAFWAGLEILVPGARALDRQLKQYPLGLL